MEKNKYISTLLQEELVGELYSCMYSMHCRMSFHEIFCVIADAGGAGLLCAGEDHV